MNVIKILAIDIVIMRNTFADMLFAHVLNIALNTASHANDYIFAKVLLYPIVSEAANRTFHVYPDPLTRNESAYRP